MFCDTLFIMRMYISNYCPCDGDNLTCNVDIHNNNSDIMYSMNRQVNYCTKWYYTWCPYKGFDINSKFLHITSLIVLLDTLPLYYILLVTIIR